MNTVTHVLAPVLLFSTVELIRKRPLDWRIVILVGLFGGAADLLDPHLALQARFTSWTHCIAGFGVLLFLPLVACFFKRLKWKHFFWFSFAYALHLFCDAIAGGICLWRPFNDLVVGKYYSMPAHWWYYDGVCVLLIFIIWDLNRKWHKTRLLWWKKEKNAK